MAGGQQAEGPALLRLQSWEVTPSPRAEVDPRAELVSARGLRRLVALQVVLEGETAAALTAQAERLVLDDGVEPGDHPLRPDSAAMAEQDLEPGLDRVTGILGGQREATCEAEQASCLLLDQAPELGFGESFGTLGVG